jgi:hypothetical protein
MTEHTITWPDLAIELFGKLTGRGAEVTYEFENLNVYIPNILGPETKHAHWKLNGTLKIRSKENSAK